MPAILPNIQRWPKREGSFSGLGRRRGRWVMAGDTRRATAFVDIDSTPRPVVNRDEYAVSFDNLPDGRVVVCSMLTSPPGDYAVVPGAHRLPPLVARRPAVLEREGRAHPLPGSGRDPRR